MCPSIQACGPEPILPQSVAHRTADRCGRGAGILVGVEILRYAAFTTDPAGGNPAGVVLDASGATDAEMLSVAADLGYSETAFLVPTGPDTARVRYFAPIAEVDFCGHATIASAVARAERHGPGRLTLTTNAGPVEVTTEATGVWPAATLVSVPTSLEVIDDAAIEDLLAALNLDVDDLDPLLPVRVGYSGNHHPIVAVTARALDGLDHDQEELAALMARHGWGATVAVVHRHSDTEFEARNPFPPGGVREDPATGSAAAALGGYLRALDLVAPDTEVVIRQGRHVGRPGVLRIRVTAAGGIPVTGNAVPLR